MACSPDEGLEEDKQGFDEHGRVHDIQGLDVFLVPAEQVENLGMGGVRGRVVRDPACTNIE